MELHCHNCNTTIKHQLKRIIGCNCDSDSPTWIAIKPGMHLIKGSQAKYTIEEAEQS
jgi:hypothetical protein